MLGGSLLAACSTQKNTPATRWWHAFNANYNTYYNGSLAFIDGALEKENGNKDNYTELIPLYTVANKNSRDLGKGNFDRAIEKSQKAIRRHSIKKRPTWDKSRKKTEKDIEWLNRKEYNPFLWKAWLMMGKSQFMKGDFEDAASTFAYMSRLYAKQPAIYGKSRAWLAKCYVEQDWLYDAEDVIKKMERDSLDWRAVKEWNYTYADYYIHCNRYEEAIPYLKKVIKRESRRKQKAREYFLLGQLYAAIGNSEDAYRAYRSCLRCHPPYELQFNARIASTCVAAEKDAQGMIGKLKRMARNENNKEYLDQVYFALGNIYLAQKDTVNAISSYEKGNEKATRSGIEKGVLLLSLGNLYWQKEKFSDAKRCYGEAIGLLDKDHKDYNTLSKRSVILDELVPHTEAIHLNDSLLALSTMDEKARNEAIDRVIAALKKREKEEADRLAEQNSAQNATGNNSFGNNNIPNRNQQQNQGFNQNQSLFYFYNPTAVSQGKQQFEKLWGKRQNVDDWQRNNKTVVAFEQDTDDEGNYTEAQLDSINKATAKADSINELMEKPENDPHKREYYMKDIPFTDEQKAGCHKLIADGLYNSGVIFKDKLDNLPLSEKQFMRLRNDYPEYENNADLYYHLFLLYNRKLQPVKGDEYLDLLKAQFPDNQWTKMLSDPYFAENARFGKQMEDSIYGATYTAFKESRFHDVYANYNLSSQRFTTGDNRDRFIFIYGLSKLNDGATQECLTSMETVVKDYPKSPVQPMAGMIINGVKEGRRLYGGT
ncbi:MAG: tetratricopeptide repeat protein, partial [Bacteroidaceae bacterium]|nr:tetratricopeptide repeat protein [Bacteroidaceae bacterium]